MRCLIPLPVLRKEIEVVRPLMSSDPSLRAKVFVKDGVATLIVQNKDYTSYVSKFDVTVVEEGDQSIPIHRLYALLPLCDTPDITLSIDQSNGDTVLESGDYLARLRTAPAMLSPITDPAEAKIEISALTLVTLLEQTYDFTAGEGAVSVPPGIVLELAKDWAYAAGIDAVRMAYAATDAALTTTSSPVVIHKLDAAVIMRLLSMHEDEQARVSVSETAFCVEVAQKKVYGRLVGCRIPPFMRVMASGAVHATANGDVEAFISAVRRVAATKDVTDGLGVILTFRPGEVEVGAGGATEAVPMTVSPLPAPIRLKVNEKFLLDALRAVGTTTFQIQIGDINRDPVRITEAHEDEVMSKYLIMPMRID